ncbi:hypothetical protein HK101_006271, partial [Irineochytrium annulatum]
MELGGPSVVDALSASGADEVVGEARWFIIHAERYSYSDLVDGIEMYAREKGEDPARTVVWLEAISLPQRNIPLKRTPLFLQEVLPGAIRHIGRSLLFIDNPFNPQPSYSYLWTYWKVYYSDHLDIIVPSVALQEFDKYLLLHSAQEVLSGWTLKLRKPASTSAKFMWDIYLEQINRSPDKLWGFLRSHVRRNIERSGTDDLDCARWNMVLANLQFDALDKAKNIQRLNSCPEAVYDAKKMRWRWADDVYGLAKKRWCGPDDPHKDLRNEAYTAYVDAEKRRRRVLGDCHHDTIEALWGFVQLMPNKKLITDMIDRIQRCGREMTDLKLRSPHFYKLDPLKAPIRGVLMYAKALNEIEMAQNVSLEGMPRVNTSANTPQPTPLISVVNI